MTDLWLSGQCPPTATGSQRPGTGDVIFTEKRQRFRFFVLTRVVRFSVQL